MKIDCDKVVCPINDSITIKFETDAEDRYFDEHLGLGVAEFSHPIIERSNLRTGIFILKLKPSIGINNLKIGDIIDFHFKITEKNKERFDFHIPIEIAAAIIPPTPPPPPPHPPHPPPIPFTRIPRPDPNTNQNQGLFIDPDFRALSREKSKTKWNKLFKGEDKRGAFVDFHTTDNGFTIWVNTSHPSLVQYQTRHPEATKKKIIDRYVNYIGYQTYAAYLLKEGNLVKYDNQDLKQMMETVSDSVALFGLGYTDAAR